MSVIKLIVNNDENISKKNEIDKDSNFFKVEKAKFETDMGDYEDRYIITKNSIPEYLVNTFLGEKAVVKASTSKTYAYSLVKLLNFLAERNIHYLDCTEYYAKQYVRTLLLGDMEDLRIKDDRNKNAYSTIRKDVTVLTEFYKFLKSEQANLKMNLKYKRMANKRSYMYGQIFEFDYVKRIVDVNIRNLKPSKEYIKWYSDEQINAIISHFSTLRDEAIFLLTLQGMRIDEVLSLMLDSINEIDGTVQPTRSKGKRDLIEYGEESSEIRNVSIPPKSFEVLQNYIMTERAQAESESGIYIDNVFINIRKGENQGEPLKYHNYLKILKNVARKAGLNINQIRTHSGRSTKVNELQEHQVLHPEDGITDEIIVDIMGWAGSSTLKAYKNRGNKVIAKAASEKVYRYKKDPKEL